MAVIKTTVTRDPDWSPLDRLRLRIGDENGVNLATSTPAGGTVVLTQEVGGSADVTRLLEAQHLPGDKSAVLIMGVDAVDAIDNVSPVFDTFVQLADAPRGPRDIEVSATANPGEALISFATSPDVYA